MVVLGWRLISVVVAALPLVVALEIARDVAASRRAGMPLRAAVDEAGQKAAPAVGWTLATLLATFAAAVGMVMFALGIVSVFPVPRTEHNPFALIGPGVVLMAIGFALGCIVAPRALRAIALLHAMVSSEATPLAER